MGQVPGDITEQQVAIKVGEHEPDIVGLASEIVSAYVRHNSVRSSDVAGLIVDVHAALTGLGQPSSQGPATDKLTPAQIRKSVTHDALVSFIDGKPYKTLKRHITKHGFTLESYRQRYGLPRDYPMTAAGYSETRAALARQAGLGSRGKGRSPSGSAKKK